MPLLINNINKFRTDCVNLYVNYRMLIFPGCGTFDFIATRGRGFCGVWLPVR